MYDYLILTLGLAFAGIGGELFVRGTLGIAQWTRVSPGIIAVTVAAFSTSSPELSVGINSALAGHPQISLGDTLGSNVYNIAFILGLALLISGIQCSRDSIRRDFPVTLLVPVVVGLLLIDGVISRGDGVIMLGLFIAWLVMVIREAQRQRKIANAIVYHDGKRALIFCIAGLLLLFVAGRLIVDSARGIALAFGVSEFVIGAIIVAAGTSIPELATTLIAKLRHQDEISLGTILGSNIFNAFFITSITAIIHPITIDVSDVAAVLIAGFLVVVFVYPPRNGLIGRGRGILLFTGYLLYLALVLR